MTEFDDFLWFIDRIHDNQPENESRIYEINNNIIIGTINNNIDEYHNTSENNIEITPTQNIVFIIDRLMEVTQEQLECCICMTEREKQDICKLNCMHTYCNQCIEQTLLKKQYTCALCRGEIKKITVQTKEIKKKFTNENSCFLNYFW